MKTLLTYFHVMTSAEIGFHLLPEWHQKILNRLMEVEFPGKEVIRSQLLGASYIIMDDGFSLKILPGDESEQAPHRRTVPVEGHVCDENGILMEVLLFIREGRVYMFEVLRDEEKKIDELPPPEKFDVFSLKG